MKGKKHIITLNGHKVYLKKDVYRARPDQIALSAFSVDPPHEPFAIVSVCMVNVKTSPGDILIKSYVENEGMLEQLIEQKIVSEPILEIPSGFVRIYLCKCLI